MTRFIYIAIVWTNSSANYLGELDSVKQNGYGYSSTRAKTSICVYIYIYIYIYIYALHINTNSMKSTSLAIEPTVRLKSRQSLLHHRKKLVAKTRAVCCLIRDRRRHLQLYCFERWSLSGSHDVCIVYFTRNTVAFSGPYLNVYSDKQQ